MLCLHVCVLYEHGCGYFWVRRVSDSLELNLQTLLHWLMWGLRSHPGCSTEDHTSLTAEPISDPMFGNPTKINLRFLEVFAL